MLLACVQTDVAFADFEANLRQAVEKISQAADQRADLVVFPECMLTGYAFDSRQEAWPHGVALDDPAFGTLAQAAAAGNLHLTIGFLETDGNHLFNAAALIGPQGIVGHYRKVHLPQLGVDRFVDPGDGPYRTLAAGDVNVSLAICYDSSFPEPMRVLGLAGADVIALGTNWPVAAARTAEIVPPARSMENHLFFVSANRIGTERGFRFYGRSAICGPDGIELARAAGDEETILYALMDVDQARNKRIERTPGKHVIDRFADRRPEFYGPICATLGSGQ